MAEVSRVATFSVSADEVWKVVGDFHGLPGWLPPVERSEPQDGGRIRRLTMADGAELVESLVSMDEAGRSCTYRIDGSEPPIMNYVATISVAETGSGCELTWSSTFDVVGVPEVEAVAMIEGVYDAGIESLRQRFGG